MLHRTLGIPRPYFENHDLTHWILNEWTLLGGLVINNYTERKQCALTDIIWIYSSALLSLKTLNWFDMHFPRHHIVNLKEKKTIDSPGNPKMKEVVHRFIYVTCHHYRMSIYSKQSIMTSSEKNVWHCQGEEFSSASLPPTFHFSALFCQSISVSGGQEVIVVVKKFF